MVDPGGRLVLHVLPTDRPRGAQALARVIIDQLDGHPDRHEALTLFDAPPGLLRPEHVLRVAPGAASILGVSPRAAWKLRRFLVQHRPAAVVSHGGEMLKYVPLALPRSTPLIYYRVGTANEHLGAPWRRRLYRRLVARCTTVVAVSDEAAAEAADLFGLDLAAIPLIPNARDPERYRRTAPPPSTSGSEIVALYVGEVAQGKGVDRFARAVAALRSEGLPVRGVVAGEGALLATLQADGPAQGIEVLGHVDDIPGLMGSADLFVFPSVDREGMPGVVIEAALCELPCVATRMPGVTSVIDDGETGYVIEPGDDAALLARMRDLVVDPDRRTSMGAEARVRSISRFSPDAIGRAWQAQLDQVLAPGR